MYKDKRLSPSNGLVGVNCTYVCRKCAHNDVNRPIHRYNEGNVEIYCILYFHLA